MHKKKQINALITQYVNELKRCLDELDTEMVEKVIEVLLQTYKKKRHVFIMGNGGSAATASHMACDLGKGTLQKIYDMHEKRFKVYSLTDNVALMSAYGNDLSFDDIFLQQLRNLVGRDDVVILLSGSGNSKNLVKAAQYAKKSGAKTIGFLGFKDGGKLSKIVDIALITNSLHYGPCEDIQLVLNHIIASSLSRIRRIQEGFADADHHNKAVPFK